MTQRTSFFDFLVTSPGGWAGAFALLSFGVLGNLIAAIIGLWSGTSTWQLGVWSLSILALLVHL